MGSAYSSALVPRVSSRTAGTTAVALVTVSTPVLVYDFTIQASSANTGVIFIGNSSSQLIALDAEESFSPGALFSRSGIMQYDLSAWYVRGSASGQVARILGVVEERQRS